MRNAEAVAFLADGARCLWKWAEENLPSYVVMIQDFWHVCEHLAQLAKDLYGESYVACFKDWQQALRAGRVEEIIADLRETQARVRGQKRKRIGEEIVYLEAGRHRMDYPRYEAEGWPIGSGAIEGTCKHMVKQRFNVTGAQWRRANIQDVLALRVSQRNGDWDRHWQELSAA